MSIQERSNGRSVQKKFRDDGDHDHSGGASERYFIQGFYEHRQMDLLVQAGLTPMQVIQSFSKNNSEMLGIDKDFGTLAKGKAADLLVLTRNPLDDIANMRTFETVYLGGKKFE